MALAYQDEGIWDPVTDSYSAYPWESVSKPSEWWQDLAKIGVNTWAAKTLMQQNQQGQQYLEGQRLAEEIARQRSLTGGVPWVLLLGGAALVYMLAKD